MSDIILHHYSLSPFSEKIRAMFGYLDINWKSSITSEVPPRVMLQPLAGNYRKIPVAQIGADIFCDTHTITTQIAHLSNKPELAIENVDQNIMEFTKDIEKDFFFACVMAASGWAMNKKALKSLSVFGLIRLIIDRVNMGRNASIKMVGPAQAPKIVKDYLPRLESLLQTDFLFGDQPNIADFAAYHALWFLREIGEKPMLREHPKLDQWMDRIKAYGEGQRTNITNQEALDIAKHSQPMTIAESHQHHDLMHELVEIAPSDYGQVPTNGVLQGCTDHSYIISRETDQAGLVHVHFPKEGFSITQV